MKSKAVLLGVDTNVVIRFLTRDDAVEAERARVIFEREEVLLLRTVLLESEWILRNSYGFQRAQIAVAFADLAALSNVQCEDAEVIAHALEWFEREWILPTRCISRRRAPLDASRPLAGSLRRMPGVMRTLQ